MDPRIEYISPMKLVGMNKKISLSNNKTAEIWQKFMPKKDEIKNRKNSKFISMSIHGSNTSDLFNSNTIFEKWAAVEVLNFSSVPEGMKTHTLQGGDYVVFIHNGPASEAPKTWKYIFGVWFPSSEYELDKREHFEILPEGYSPVDPNAKEEVWIPIIKK